MMMARAKEDKQSWESDNGPTWLFKRQGSGDPSYLDHHVFHPPNSRHHRVRSKVEEMDGSRHVLAWYFALSMCKFYRPSDLLCWANSLVMNC